MAWHQEHSSVGRSGKILDYNNKRSVSLISYLEKQVIDLAIYVAQIVFMELGN